MTSARERAANEATACMADVVEPALRTCAEQANSDHFVVEVVQPPAAQHARVMDVVVDRKFGRSVFTMESTGRGEIVISTSLRDGSADEVRLDPAVVTADATAARFAEFLEAHVTLVMNEL